MTESAGSVAHTRSTPDLFAVHIPTGQRHAAQLPICLSFHYDNALAVGACAQQRRDRLSSHPGDCQGSAGYDTPVSPGRNPVSGRTSGRLNVFVLERYVQRDSPPHNRRPPQQTWTSDSFPDRIFPNPALVKLLSFTLTADDDTANTVPLDELGQQHDGIDMPSGSSDLRAASSRVAFQYRQSVPAGRRGWHRHGIFSCQVTVRPSPRVPDHALL